MPIPLNSNSFYNNNNDKICSEWMTNIQRDTLASIIGHPSQLTYFSVAKNQSVARLRYEYMEVNTVFK